MIDKYGGATVVRSIASHECPYCNRTYGSLAGVASHLVVHHAGEKIPPRDRVELPGPA